MAAYFVLQTTKRPDNEPSSQRMACIKQVDSTCHLTYVSSFTLKHTQIQLPNSKQNIKDSNLVTTTQAKSRNNTKSTSRQGQPRCVSTRSKRFSANSARRRCVGRGNSWGATETRGQLDAESKSWRPQQFEPTSAPELAGPDIRVTVKQG